MMFVDLTDTDFLFSCDLAGDACEYWNYDFCVEYRDERHIKNLSYYEIEQLRENCLRILRATEGC